MLLLVAASISASARAAGPESAHQPRSPGASASGGVWEILFEDDLSTEEYARQIDYFKIEIGAISKNGKVEYVSNASQYKPAKRVGNVAQDYRLHVGWKKGTLHAADRKLLAKAGISTQNKELMHYLPAALQAQMEKLERDYAKNPGTAIRRTRFLVRAKDADGYEMVVTEQE